MEQAKKVVIETFNTNSFLISKALEGLSDDDFFARPNESCNPIHFLLGHLINYRYQGSGMLGGTDQFEHTDLYAMGEKVGDKSIYPTADALKSEWQKITKTMQTLLENADTVTLAKKTPKKQPIGEQNVMGTLQFLLFHETYHLGQICLVRKFHGYESIIG